MFRIDQVAISTFSAALNTTDESINPSAIYLYVCLGMNVNKLFQDVDTELSVPYKWV
jgi:hypothetical protein